MKEEWKLEHDQVITLLSYTPPSGKSDGDEILLNISDLSDVALDIGGSESLMKVKILGENFTAEAEKPNSVLIKAVHKTKAISSWIYPNYDKPLVKCNTVVSGTGPMRPIYLDL